MIEVIDFNEAAKSVEEKERRVIERRLEGIGYSGEKIIAEDIKKEMKDWKAVRVHISENLRVWLQSREGIVVYKIKHYWGGKIMRKRMEELKDNFGNEYEFKIDNLFPEGCRLIATRKAEETNRNCGRGILNIVDYRRQK